MAVLETSNGESGVQKWVLIVLGEKGLEDSSARHMSLQECMGTLK